MNNKNKFGILLHSIVAQHGHFITRMAELSVVVTVFIFLSPHILAIQPVTVKPTLEGPYSGDTLLVKFKPNVRAKIREGNVANTGEGNVDKILTKHRAKGFKKVAKTGKKSKTSAEFFGWYKVSLDPSQATPRKLKDGKIVYPDLEQAKSELEKDPSVQQVTKDYLIKSSLVPDDPYYTSSGTWGQGYDDLWGLKKINAAGAWDTTTGSSSIIAAIIDTGVDRTHADISANIWTNPGEIAGNGIDDDGNGYIDDVYGWNWVSGNNNTADDNGHGTHVAGTIAGAGNNSTGVVGVSWNTKIMSLKFLNSAGSGFSSNAALALQYAADMGAKVSNNSYGCQCNSAFYDDAIKYEHDRNVTAVVAAGNEGIDALSDGPGNSDGAINVGSTTSTDALSGFSNKGIRVDVVAPGQDILSLKSSTSSTVCVGAEIVNTNYCHISGTSMATPHVVGLISLMLARNASLTPEQIRQILHTTSQDLGTAGHDNTYGFGRIDAPAAVAAAPSPTVLTPFITNPKSRATISGSINFTGDANGTSFSSYKLEIGAGRAPSSWTTLTTSSTPITAGNLLASFDTTTIQDGTYIFRLTATTSGGASYEYSVYDVVIDNFDAVISSPANIVSFSPAIPVIGSAVTKNGAPFSHYTLDYGVGVTPSSWSSAGLSLAGGGNSPVSANTLATWNTASLTNNQVYTFRLTVFTTGGGSTSTTLQVTPDSNLVSGWPKYISTWNCVCNGEATAIADLNGDGTKEAIVPAGADKLYVFNKDGTNFPGFPATMTALDHFNNPPVVADIDGDGKQEIIITGTNGYVTYSKKRIYVIRYDGSFYPGWPTPLLNAPAIQGDDPTPSVADIDGDGQKELILAEGAAGVGANLHAYHLNGTEVSGFPKAIPALTREIPLTVADLDHDGHPEIILVDYKKVYVYDYQGNLKSGWPQTAPRYNTLGLEEIFDGPASIGDIDGDGTSEIVAETVVDNGFGFDNLVLAWKPNGTLMSGYPLPASKGGFGGWGNTAVTTGDIDNDGKDEMLLGNDIAAIVDDGSGKKTVQTQLGTPTLGLADFDGSGIPKISGYKYSSPGTFIWGNSDLSTYWSNNNVTTGAASYYAPATADMDNNGHLESLTTSISGPNLNEEFAYLWEMPGTTTTPKDVWPMYAHDAAHTNHYTVGQIVPDTTPPTVSLTSPSAGIALYGTVPVSASASDDIAVSTVTFYVDGAFIGSANSPPFAINWNSWIGSGNHTLKAVATDSSGNTAEYQIIINIPKVGDLNADGVINIFDLSILLSSYGKTSIKADLNHNGGIDIFDLSTLLSAYGK